MQHRLSRVDRSRDPGFDGVPVREVVAAQQHLPRGLRKALEKKLRMAERTVEFHQ
jgi:hypothetical protein